MSTTARLLLWLEMGLLAIGVALGAWCAIVIVEARYYHALPIPAPSAPKALPGDATAGDHGAADTPAPPRAAAVGSWIARLDAPSVGLSATVLEGSDDGTLAHGAGHIEDTAFPGDPGNFGVAGHRDTTFRPVRNLHAGDPLIVTTAGHVFSYRITKTTIVNPDDVGVLDNADHPTLTLVTCYPFEFIGHAPRRFIVSADLVGTAERDGETGGAGAGMAEGAGMAGGAGGVGRSGVSGRAGMAGAPATGAKRGR